MAVKNAEQSDLSEFMQLTKARGAQRLWANDDGVGDAASNLQRRGQHTKDSEKGSVVRQQAVASRKPGGEGVLLTKTHVAFEDDSAESDDEYADLEVKETGSLDPTDAPGVGSALNWLKAKARTDFDDDDDDDDNDDNDRRRKMKSDRTKAVTDVGVSVAEVAPPRPAAKGKQSPLSKMPSVDVEPAASVSKARWKHGGDGEELDDVEPIEESGRLFVRNLNFSVTSEELEELFRVYGEIAEIHLPVDTKASKAKGFAFVAYMMPECAKEAAERLDKTIFQGRLLHILPAKALPKKEEAEADGEGLSYKQKKKAETKKKAADSTNWNSLYMRADAVADSVASRFAMDKASFLDPQGENVAVRLALAETHLIDETKKCFVDHGVDLDVLEGTKKSAKRSATVILVKNIPFSTTAAELRSLFGKFGEIARLVLPPARTIALVEFVEQNR
jgi:multiple RNA-binding domain-containing protein 1